MNKGKEKPTEEKVGFSKNGQVKVYKEASGSMVKKANSNQEEYGIDDLIKDSEEGGTDVGSSRD